MSALRTAPVGDRALLALPDDADDAGCSARVRALDRELRARSFDGFVESVPAVRSLLVVFAPGAAAEAHARLREAAAAPVDAQPAGRLHLVPTRYGGADGPDLPEVARACGLTEDEVVARHAAGEYSALMLGFRPGYAYLGWLPEALRTPRRATPRVRVPAGSVAVAGLQTGIYPSGSAGGWNLIGRAAVTLFDPTRDPPALFAPDDRVRFVPTHEPLAPDAGVAAADTGSGPAALEVLEGGLLTTVQDRRGRVGYRRLGVAAAGALDPCACAAANAALGNADEAAVLECTVVGPTLRALRPLRIALAGADLGAVLERDDLGRWPVPLGTTVLMRPGNVLRFTGRVSGCRAYLACAGGIDVPALLGSRSTDLAAGFGGYAGRALRAGDVLALGDATGRARDTTAPAASQDVAAVRVVPGPQQERFTADALARFLATEWRVGPTSDRAACRLEGPALAHAGSAEIASEGMVPGCVQVPPDGQPIVMLADGPTTGGYAKIATVVADDVPRLAQLLPGAGRVRFQA